MSKNVIECVFQKRLDRRKANVLALCTLAVAGGLGLPTAAWAQYTEKTLYSFSQGADGEYPGSLVFDNRGNLYGTTNNGGYSQAGLAFELSPPGSDGRGWTETVLQDFCPLDSVCLGSGSSGLVRDSKGNLYGTAGVGGTNAYCSDIGCGEIFELSAPASGGAPWSYRVLYAFCSAPDCADGVYPGAGLALDPSGNLYGTTLEGGNPADCLAGGCGVVFRLQPPGGANGEWEYSVLYKFSGADDGGRPSGLVLDNMSNLYGAASIGGGYTAPGCEQAGCGVIFELSPPVHGGGAWTEAVLHAFTGGIDGGDPIPHPIFDSRGNVYGTTSNGGVDNCGVAYELTSSESTPYSWSESVLYSFSGCIGGSVEPSGLVFDMRGNLYGTQVRGGLSTNNCAPYGCGIVFKLTPQGTVGQTWDETVLYSFTGGSDGAGPYSGVIFDSRGNLYGTTIGELDSFGTVWELSPPPPTATTTSLASSLNPSTVGDSVMLTAVVSPIGSQPQTGTVGFTSNGSTISGCSAIALSTAEAVCTTSALPVGTGSIVATYSGDSNYAGSTSVPLLQIVNPAILPQLQLSATPNSIDMLAGQSGTVSLAVSASGPVSSAVTFSCSGLPTDATCSFSPSSVASLPATVMMTVNTTSADASLPPSFRHWPVALGLMLPGLLFLTSRRKNWRKLAVLPFCCAILLLALTLAGCGSGSFKSYVVTITASAPGAISGATGLVVTVTR